MQSDYDAILNDNIKEYGEGRKHLALYGKLYSNKTHFIFELIQNAEDAGATRIAFNLFEDRLEVVHNGRLFTTQDVKGICGIGVGTKEDDLTMIGRFGLGFKSVYAYTRTPKIHSGDEHFRIEDYVRPFAEREFPTISKGDTMFVLPFDSSRDRQREDALEDGDTGTSEDVNAVHQISNALNNLEPSTLLFLQNLEQIAIDGIGVAARAIVREPIVRSDWSRHVTLYQVPPNPYEDSEWVIWERIVGERDGKTLRVEIAFSESEKQLQSHDRTELVVFFPTAKETNLGFLIHGPYRTTPNRENVDEGTIWNRLLVSETALLLKDVLIDIRDSGLLTTAVLEALPLNSDDFKERSMFRPIFDEIKKSFATDQLIPIYKGGFGKASEVILPRPAALRDLLSPEQLSQVTMQMTQASFVSELITEIQTHTIWNYFRSELGVAELTPANFLGGLSSEFLSEQPDEWLILLYKLLIQNSGLIESFRRSASSAAQAPILRLEGDEHVPLFDDAGNPSAYLPPETDSEFPTIKRGVASDPDAYRFFASHGFIEPDAASEVYELVLPRYENLDVDDIEHDRHLRDIESIINALRESKSDRREEFVRTMRECHFLIGVNESTAERRLCKPTEIYLPTTDLRIYFEGNPNVWFLFDYPEDYISALKPLGLQSEIRITAKRTDGGYRILEDQWGHHSRGLDGFDPNLHIDELTFALRNPTIERSRLIWNTIFSPHHSYICGVVETSTQKSYVNPIIDKRFSLSGDAARNLRWLPDSAGEFHIPSDLHLEDLPLGFNRDINLAQLLGMAEPELEDASLKTEIPVDILMALKGNREFQDKVRKLLESENASRPMSGDEEPVEPFDYKSAFKDALRQEKEIDSSHASDNLPDNHGDVANPERREEMISEEIETNQENEPKAVDRYRRVPSRFWNARSRDTRIFLLEQYRGRCQVCNSTFAMKDHQPYFEAVFIVPFSRQQWIDRPGNVLCLCATCCSKFQYGAVDDHDFFDQVVAWTTKAEGGLEAAVTLELCGVPVKLHYTEKHLLDLKTMLT